MENYAVMNQRIEGADSLDDFPTPPWAARALIEHVIKRDLSTKVCHEPTCGRGYMAEALAPYFNSLIATDIISYGYERQLKKLDFLQSDIKTNWIITNPPFNKAEAFVFHALSLADEGVALFERTSFIETVGRYNNLFSKIPPTIVAQFSERVPLIKGRLSKAATTATSYCWLVWLKPTGNKTELVWIPPCRKALEKDSDYPPQQILTLEDLV